MWGEQADNWWSNCGDRSFYIVIQFTRGVSSSYVAGPLLVEGLSASVEGVIVNVNFLLHLFSPDNNLTFLVSNNSSIHAHTHEYAPRSTTPWRKERIKKWSNSCRTPGAPLGNAISKVHCKFWLNERQMNFYPLLRLLYMKPATFEVVKIETNNMQPE